MGARGVHEGQRVKGSRNSFATDIVVEVMQQCYRGCFNRHTFCRIAVTVASECDLDYAARPMPLEASVGTVARHVGREHFNRQHVFSAFDLPYCDEYRSVSNNLDNYQLTADTIARSRLAGPNK